MFSQIARCWPFLNLYQAARKARWLTPAWLVGTTALLAWRLGSLIAAYSAHIPFYDQYTCWFFIFRGDNAFSLFDRQIAPHRMGLGLLLSAIVGKMSGWNAAAEGWAIYGVILLALLAAMLLTRRLRQERAATSGPASVPSGASRSVSWAWTDAVLPILFLSPAAYETYIGTPFPAYSALPLLLILAFALCWTLPAGPSRSIGLVVFAGLTVFTGNGLLMMPIFLLLLLGECWRLRRSRSGEFRRALMSLMALLLIDVLFFCNYSMSEAMASGESGPYPKSHGYLPLMAVMHANFLGLAHVHRLWIGGGILALLLSVTLWHGYCWLRSYERTHAVLLALGLFCLIYTGMIAVGRVHFGPEGGLASRYVTLLTTGYLALYLHGLTLSTPRRRILWQAGFLLLCLLFMAPLRSRDVREMRWYYQRKTAWEQAYLRTGDIAAADHEAPLPIFPEESKAWPKFAFDMAYLRTHHLSFFSNPDVVSAHR